MVEGVTTGADAVGSLMLPSSGAQRNVVPSSKLGTACRAVPAMSQIVVSAVRARVNAGCTSTSTESTYMQPASGSVTTRVYHPVPAGWAMGAVAAGSSNGPPLQACGNALPSYRPTTRSSIAQLSWPAPLLASCRRRNMVAVVCAAIGSSSSIAVKAGYWSSW